MRSSSVRSDRVAEEQSNLDSAVMHFGGQHKHENVCTASVAKHPQHPTKVTPSLR